MGTTGQSVRHAGMTDFVTLLQYYGAAAGAIAALVVSLDLGRKVTGIGFVVFVTSSIALIAWGFLNPDAKGIGTQNVVLLAINLIGVYRYLIRRTAKRRGPPQPETASTGG
jgi:uncharacterized membrane protein (DUF2068 family)